jgi:hypothetical protein
MNINLSYKAAKVVVEALSQYVENANDIDPDASEQEAVELAQMVGDFIERLIIKELAIKVLTSS